MVVVDRADPPPNLLASCTCSLPCSFFAITSPRRYSERLPGCRYRRVSCSHAQGTRLDLNPALSYRAPGRALDSGAHHTSSHSGSTVQTIRDRARCSLLAVLGHAPSPPVVGSRQQGVSTTEERSMSGLSEYLAGDNDGPGGKGRLVVCPRCHHSFEFNGSLPSEWHSCPNCSANGLEWIDVPRVPFDSLPSLSPEDREVVRQAAVGALSAIFGLPADLTGGVDGEPSFGTENLP